MAELRTWRQRIATPLKGSGDANSGETSPDKPDKLTNPPFPSSEFVRKPSLTNPDSVGQTPDPHRPDPRPRLLRIAENKWVLADWARELCVYCPEPLAPGDIISCVTHKAMRDGVPMPWDR